MPLYSLSLQLPADLDPAKVGSFASMACGSGLCRDHPAPLAGTASRKDSGGNGYWLAQWLFDKNPDAARFASVLFEAQQGAGLDLSPLSAHDLTSGVLPEDGWLARSYRTFEPFRESGFYIYGSHAVAPEPGADIPLQIDAATAFGSGAHETTAGCLAMMRALYQGGYRPEKILDLGTGSGILAVAAWALWGAPVLATDIDAEAVRVAKHHRLLNAVPETAMGCIEADGLASPVIATTGPFDLVIANILAGPLKALASGIAAITKPTGRIILSGLLDEQQTDVLAAYESSGFFMQRIIMRGDWATLLLEKAVA